MDLEQKLEQCNKASSENEFFRMLVCQDINYVKRQRGADSMKSAHDAQEATNIMVEVVEELEKLLSRLRRMHAAGKA